MGGMGDVGMVLVVGGLGLYLLYAYNTGQLQQFGFSAPDSGGDTTNITNEIAEDSSGSTSSGTGTPCNTANYLGCCTDNAGNTCWRGTTTNGVKVGGCQPDSTDCSAARDDFVDQFGEDAKDDSKDKKKSGGSGTTPSTIGPTKVGKGGKVISKPSSVPSGSKAACDQFSGATRDACLRSRYASAYLGSAFNRRGPSYNYRDDFSDPEHMKFPDKDWYDEASKHPFYLGDVSLERDMLLKRFQSNFGRMRLSIA